MTLARAAGAEDSAPLGRSADRARPRQQRSRSDRPAHDPARSRPAPRRSALDPAPAVDHRRHAGLGRAVDRRGRDRGFARLNPVRPTRVVRRSGARTGPDAIKLPLSAATRLLPDWILTQCPVVASSCLFNKQLDKTLRVCPNCGHHFRLSANARIDLLLGGRSGARCRTPVGRPARLHRPGRPIRIGPPRRSALPTGVRGAAVGAGTHRWLSRVAIVRNGLRVHGRAMGAVVGEKVTWRRGGRPCCANPGDRRVGVAAARMQEGTLALEAARGQDRGRHRTGCARAASLACVDPDGPDHRRRVRLVRGAG